MYVSLILDKNLTQTWSAVRMWVREKEKRLRVDSGMEKVCLWMHCIASCDGLTIHAFLAFVAITHYGCYNMICSRFSLCLLCCDMIFLPNQSQTKSSNSPFLCFFNLNHCFARQVIIKFYYDILIIIVKPRCLNHSDSPMNTISISSR